MGTTADKPLCTDELALHATVAGPPSAVKSLREGAPTGAPAARAEIWLQSAISGALSNPHQELISTIQDFHQRGWCDGTGGNFSVVLEHDPLSLLMAPSGVDKGQVEAEMLITVNANGEVTDGTGRASAETLMHLTIVKALASGAVLHTHSTTATVVSKLAQDQGMVELEGWEMLKGLQGITTHETKVQIPVVGNDQDLKRLSSRCEPLLSTAPHGLLVAGHGLYAWGNTLAEARRHVEILEFLLELHWKQLLINH